MSKPLEPSELITMLADVLNRKLTPQSLMGYEVALADVPLDALNAAVMTLLRTSRFMPSPAEIREAAGAVGGLPAPKDRPTLAWIDVRRAISQVDAYGSPDFDDKLINATIRAMGGWVALCDATLEQLIWREKDFKQTYAALASQNLPDEMTTRLAGICEKENGPCHPPPVHQIGCLTAGTHRIKRIDQPIERPRRIENTPAAILAKRLTFDDRPDDMPQPPQRTKAEILEQLQQFESTHGV